MLRRVSSLLFFIFLSTAVWSQDAFLEFDTSCMMRLEYKIATSTNPYIAYSALLPNGSLLIMDVGSEAPAILRNKPARLYKCQNFNLSLADVNQINAGQIKLSVFLEDNSRLTAYAVDKVTLMQQTGEGINVYAQDAVFTFNPDSLVSGKNLASDNSKTQVYLEGIVKSQCAEGYIFRRKENADASAYKEWVIIPEIGIVEKSSVQGSGFLSDAKKSSLRLHKVGDQPYFDFLTKWCDEVQASYYDGKNPRSKGDYKDLVEQPADTNSEKNNAVDPCAPTKEPGIHIVQKGETLYSLSRRYGVSLQDLREWNGLQGTDVISICQRLLVADPKTLIQPSDQEKETTEPSSASESVFSQPKEISGSAWQDAPEFHTVRPGETVAMLAYMYGYTEERFRKMNGLGANEAIIPGQKLRTSDCVCPTGTAASKSATSTGEKEAGMDKDKEVDNDDVFFKPIRVHVVQKTDTLFSIAKQYNTTPERIMELNGMSKGDKIRPGQRLYVQ